MQCGNGTNDNFAMQFYDKNLYRNEILLAIDSSS